MVTNFQRRQLSKGRPEFGGFSLHYFIHKTHLNFEDKYFKSELV